MFLICNLPVLSSYEVRSSSQTWANLICKFLQFHSVVCILEANLFSKIAHFGGTCANIVEQIPKKYKAVYNPLAIIHIFMKVGDRNEQESRKAEKEISPYLVFTKCLIKLSFSWLI